MKIAGFLKVRNEIIREGNLYRVLANLEQFCDGGILCDDASTDGTREALDAFVATHANWALLKIEASQQSFENERAVKQLMLRQLEPMGIAWDWIYWADGDEELDRPTEFRAWVESIHTNGLPGYRFHYTQLWRSKYWARVDDGFDEGVFLKLWRYQPGLSFDERPGTHQPQFPTQVEYARCPIAPFEVIHWGNYGKNIVWKAIQYANGRGGVDRHIAFGHSPAESLATSHGWDEAKWSAPQPRYRALAEIPPHEPKPFTLEEIRRIRSMGDLRALPGWFAVVVPAYNRADTLTAALLSLQAQTYEKWIALVLDDGSTDHTEQVMAAWQEKDPRVFYAKYPTNRGGVAMNELGMAMACEMAEYWSRLGSDDWFGRRKLELDAIALKDHEAVFGVYRASREGRLEEDCCKSLAPGVANEMLKAGRFTASWANCAVRASVLRRVHERFGSFVDPRLRNMEDFLFNARVAAVGAQWVWRGWRNGSAVVNPPEAGLGTDEFEAAWNDCSTGATGNREQSARDDVLTRQLIAEECR